MGCLILFQCVRGGRFSFYRRFQLYWHRANTLGQGPSRSSEGRLRCVTYYKHKLGVLRTMMKIKNLRPELDGVRKLDLSVGGFVIKNCRWKVAARQILFPVRYDRDYRRYVVARAGGKLVKRLRELLESGDLETPRDRRRASSKFASLDEAALDGRNGSFSTSRYAASKSSGVGGNQVREVSSCPSRSSLTNKHIGA